jgi:hypothetical protein
MKLSTRAWLIGLAVLIAGGAIGAGVMWASQNSRTKKLEAEKEALEQQLKDEQPPASSEPSTPPDASSGETTPAPSSPAAPAAPAKSAPSAASTAEDGRHFCYVKTVKWEGSTPKITVDYAEMLSGAAAAAAAAAAGEESPPPNDYFISNKNPKLRTFPMSTSAKIKMISGSEGLVMEGYSMTVSAWFDAFSGMSGYFPAIKQVRYWITIKNGTVIRIEEQYLP